MFAGKWENFRLFVYETLLYKMKRREKKEGAKPIPGRAVLIENKIIEEKPFLTNDELPEAELYFGGEKETESEHDLRMIRISQREEMSRL